MKRSNPTSPAYAGIHVGIIMDGNGRWAAARGLPNLRTTLDALPQLITEEAMELFSKYGVFTHREMHSRYEIGLEHYALSVGVEARLTLEIGTTSVLPAAVRYQTEVALNLGALQAAGIAPDTGALEDLSALVTSLHAGLSDLTGALAAHAGSTALEEAQHAQSALLPAMAAVRSAADKLEGVVADDLWPLPTYQEMLFIL